MLWKLKHFIQYVTVFYIGIQRKPCDVWWQEKKYCQYCVAERFSLITFPWKKFDSAQEQFFSILIKIFMLVKAITCIL